MADYGLLTTGFVRKRLPEIKAEIANELKIRTGLTWDTDPETLTGQFIAVFAEREASIWEIMESVHYSMYPNSAYGKALDDAVSFAGVERLRPSRAQATVEFFGAEGTSVPSYAALRDNFAGVNYSVLDGAFNITMSRASTVVLRVVTVEPGTLYGSYVNGVLYTAMTLQTDGAAEIAQKLAVALTGSGLTCTSVGDTITCHSDDLTVFDFLPGSRTPVQSVATPSNVYSDDYVTVAPAANAITSLLTNVPGVTSVSNPVEGYAGRTTELDSSLKERYKQGVFRLGAGTLNAMLASIPQNVSGVDYIKGYENTGDSVDASGRPAHSFELVIDGGDTQKLGDEIFRLKPAGIATVGTTAVSVVDVAGETKTVRFNRATQVYIWLKLVITPSPEEKFSGDLLITGSDTLAEFGNAHSGIGTDVILQKLLAPIYDNYTGIASVTITAVKTTQPLATPADNAYTADNISIGEREVAIFDPLRITMQVTA